MLELMRPIHGCFLPGRFPRRPGSVAPLVGQAVAEPELAGAGVRRQATRGADQDRLAEPHHDALDGLHVSLCERVEARHHLGRLVAE